MQASGPVPAVRTAFATLGAGDDNEAQDRLEDLVDARWDL
jgi:hypothetical protein